MLNIDDFIKKLNTILDYYNLSASSFADKINIQRSSMSHLLSGRNKPSLDFALKLVEVFPEVDLYWLLTSKGSFPKKSDTYNGTNQKIETHPTISLEAYNDTSDGLDLFSTSVEPQNNVNKIKTEVSQKQILSEIENLQKETDSKDKKIHSLLICYTDGTFKEFKPDFH